jgi:hypothetical protein
MCDFHVQLPFNMYLVLFLLYSINFNFNLVLIVCMKCHAHMHGLIHDGRLWACQSCLLGLMYALRVNVCS